MAQPTLKEILLRNISPAHLICLGVYQFILTVIDIITVQYEPRLLFQLSKLRDRAFSRFWTAYGALMSEGMADEAVALLQTVHGTVLDVGPGSGDQLRHLNASQLDRVYGAEPALELHGRLRAHARQAGLEAKYAVLQAGAQPESLLPALAGAGVFARGGADGVFDDICCVRVLCGVPRPEETVQGLYRLLKPGGRLIVHEHVVNPWPEEGGSLLSRALQTVYTCAGWPFFLGCHLTRDTKGILINAAGKDGWAKVELKGLASWSAIPNCTGYLVKRE
ncbi:hypothetical protein SLS56_004302 [Neofusicoccum ribis]|uniref:Phospholipid methyltransferase n=1 Tax=Neofusicoccum ribis TaxID=45134 RepID=A0ABR3SXH2_9PEZI